MVAWGFGSSRVFSLLQEGGGTFLTLFFCFIPFKVIRLGQPIQSFLVHVPKSYFHDWLLQVALPAGQTVTIGILISELAFLLELLLA